MSDTPVYEFAKLFTLDGHQLVITRERSEGGETKTGPALIIRTCNGDLYAEGCMVLADTEEGEGARDRLFHDLDPETLEGTSIAECARAVIQHVTDVTNHAKKES